MNIKRIGRVILFSLLIVSVLSGIIISKAGILNNESHFSVNEEGEVVEGDWILWEKMTQRTSNGRYTTIVISEDEVLRRVQIWVIDMITGDEWIVASSKGDYNYVSTPVFSPGEDKIAYFSFYPYEIWSADLNGENKELIASEGTIKEYNEDNEIDPAIHLFPALSNANQVFLEWTDKGVVFEDTVSIPKKRYVINVNTEEITAVSNTEQTDTGEVAGTSTIDRNLYLPYYSQNDERWESDDLGTCEDISIGAAGCAITAVAMVIDYYGEDITPQQLNEKLMDYDVSGYYDGCDIMWYMIPTLFEEITMKGIYFNKFDPVRLDYELSLGHPVIVGFDSVNFAPIPHWVVITGKDGEDYFTNDPWTGEQKPLSYFGTKFDHMVVYTGVE